MKSPCSACKLAIVDIIHGTLHFKFGMDDLVRMVEWFGMTYQWLSEHVLKLHRQYGGISGWMDTVVKTEKLVALKWEPEFNKRTRFNEQGLAPDKINADPNKEDAATQTDNSAVNEEQGVPDVAKRNYNTDDDFPLDYFSLPDPDWDVNLDYIALEPPCFSA